jgi:hypothetical protein
MRLAWESRSQAPHGSFFSVLDRNRLARRPGALAAEHARRCQAVGFRDKHVCHAPMIVPIHRAILGFVALLAWATHKSENAVSLHGFPPSVLGGLALNAHSSA